MNQPLLEDLAAFERGALTRSEVVGRHGVEALPALAAHDRLREAVATVPSFDLEAGWARVIAEIAEPAPVVRLQPKPRRPRTIVLAAAAALMLAGSAFAALGPRLFADDRPMVPMVSDDPGDLAGGESRGGGGVVGKGTDDPAPKPGDPTGGLDGSGDAEGPGQGGSADDGSGGGTDAPEDPNDRDQGRGNDGHHDDQGGGNDGREGQGKPTSRDTPTSQDGPRGQVEPKGQPKDR